MHACVLLGYLPTDKVLDKELTTKECARVRSVYFTNLCACCWSRSLWLVPVGLRWLAGTARFGASSLSLPHMWPTSQSSALLRARSLAHAQNASVPPTVCRTRQASSCAVTTSCHSSYSHVTVHTHITCLPHRYLEASVLYTSLVTLVP